MGFKGKSLIDNLGKIITGKTPSTKNSEYWNGNIPFVTPKDLQGSKHIISTERKITKLGAATVKGSIIPINSVCVSCIGVIGYVGITTEESVSNQQINSIIVNENNDTDYVYYLMKWLWPYFKNYEGQSTTLSILNKTHFSKIEIPIYPLDYQRKVSKLLSMIDDKIELNQQINKNLEEQIQAIFASYFITDNLFETMEKLPLSDLCTTITKGTTPTTLGKSFVDSGINFIKAESILDNHSIDTAKFAFIDDDTNQQLKRSIIHNKDILFTIAGTLGRFAFVDNAVLPANTNQAVAIIRTNAEKITPEYLYSFFIGNWHNDYYTKRIQQAVQANLSLTTIKSLPIPILPTDSMKKYLSVIIPIIAMIKHNENENRRLMSTRDALLPRLMSGEIDVSKIEI